MLTLRSLMMLPLALCAPMPASARVDAVSDTGFVSRHEVLVSATPERAWAAMLSPGEWWSSSHTYSGDAASLTIEPRAGGCFCERIPSADGSAEGQVEHMRVLYLAPHQTLRMTGGLGPLQGEAVSGVLTVTFEQQEGATSIAWGYVVGGYSVASLRELAPLVDQVIGEQLLRLATRLGQQWDGRAPRL